jgi:hypothetical protein
VDVGVIDQHRAHAGASRAAETSFSRSSPACSASCGATSARANARRNSSGSGFFRLLDRRAQDEVDALGDPRLARSPGSRGLQFEITADLQPARAQLVEELDRAHG